MTKEFLTVIVEIARTKASVEEKVPGCLSIGFNIPLATHVLQEKLGRIAPYVEEVLKHHGGEVLYDGQEYQKAVHPFRESPVLLIRATEEAIKAILLHSDVSSCTVLEQREHMRFDRGMDGKPQVSMFNACYSRARNP